MTLPPYASADTSTKFATPNLLDETVYRPDCPFEDARRVSLWEGCRTW
jgi:hypothetical protein